MPFSLEHDLSEELLDIIISLSSRDSLTKLCLSSKKLNRIATPHLYSSVLFNRYTSDTSAKHLCTFAYLIFSSPLHASFVQSFASREAFGWGAGSSEEEKPKGVHLNDEYDKRNWPKYAKSELDGVLKKKCVEYAVDAEEAEAIYEQIRTGEYEDLIVTLLLANLPNLRKVDICLVAGLEQNELLRLIDRVADRVKPFDKLPAEIEFTPNDNLKASSSTAFSMPMDLLITGDSDKYPNDTDHIAMVLKLPNLRSLYSWMMGDEGDPSDDSAFKKLKPRSCPVEYIELRTSKLHSDHLQLLMDATIPGRLKTFNYEIGGAWAWVDIEHPKIMKSLEAHHDTLECLALSHEEYYPYDTNSDNDKSDPVAFNSFKMLKRLKAAPVYIWGHEGFCNKLNLKNPKTREWLWKGLPATLEELWITRAVEQEAASMIGKRAVRFIPDLLIPALELVVQYKSQAYPKLSHLRIEFQLVRWKNAWIKSLVSLCRQAEENGIRCTVILTDSQQESYASRHYAERGWGWNEEIEWQECIHNHEPPKVWVEVAKEKNLSEKLMGLIKKEKEIKQKLKEEQEVETVKWQEKWAKKNDQDEDAEDD